MIILICILSLTSLLGLVFSILWIKNRINYITEVKKLSKIRKYLISDYTDRILVLENYNNYPHEVNGSCTYALVTREYSYDKQTYSELKRTLKIIKETHSLSHLSFLNSEIQDTLLEYRKKKLKRILK